LRTVDADPLTVAKVGSRRTGERHRDNYSGSTVMSLDQAGKLTTWSLTMVAIMVTVGGCSSDRLYDLMLKTAATTVDKELKAVERADRMVIHARDGGIEDRTTQEAPPIKIVVAFYERYRDGWMMLSGASGQYDFYLYREGQLVGRLGLTASSQVYPDQDTLTVGDRFRRVPAVETADLARRLNLPWPPRH
jgi:hypothetical protein